MGVLGLSMMDGRRVAALAFAALALAGCSMMGGGGSGDIAAPAPAPVLEPQLLPAGEIRTILAGKSWRFRGPNNTGTTLYAGDGSSLVEVDGKGKTKGKWMTKDGQLCESFDPAPPWLPGGVPMSCYPFAKGAAPGSYQAGKAVFTPAS